MLSKVLSWNYTHFGVDRRRGYSQGIGRSDGGYRNIASKGRIAATSGEDRSVEYEIWFELFICDSATAARVRRWLILEGQIRWLTMTPDVRKLDWNVISGAPRLGRPYLDGRTDGTDLKDLERREQRFETPGIEDELKCHHKSKISGVFWVPRKVFCPSGSSHFWKSCQHVISYFLGNTRDQVRSHWLDSGSFGSMVAQ